MPNGDNSRQQYQPGDVYDLSLKMLIKPAGYKSMSFSCLFCLYAMGGTLPAASEPVPSSFKQAVAFCSQSHLSCSCLLRHSKASRANRCGGWATLCWPALAGCKTPGHVCLRHPAQECKTMLKKHWKVESIAKGDFDAMSHGQTCIWKRLPNSSAISPECIPIQGLCAVWPLLLLLGGYGDLIAKCVKASVPEPPKSPAEATG